MHFLRQIMLIITICIAIPHHVCGTEASPPISEHSGYIAAEIRQAMICWLQPLSLYFSRKIRFIANSVLLRKEKEKKEMEEEKRKGSSSSSPSASSSSSSLTEDIAAPPTLEISVNENFMLIKMSLFNRKIVIYDCVRREECGKEKSEGLSISSSSSSSSSSNREDDSQFISQVLQALKAISKNPVGIKI